MPSQKRRQAGAVEHGKIRQAAANVCSEFNGLIRTLEEKPETELDKAPEGCREAEDTDILQMRSLPLRGSCGEYEKAMPLWEELATDCPGSRCSGVEPQEDASGQGSEQKLTGKPKEQKCTESHEAVSGQRSEQQSTGEPKEQKPSPPLEERQQETHGEVSRPEPESLPKQQESQLESCHQAAPSV